MLKIDVRQLVLGVSIEYFLGIGLQINGFGRPTTRFKIGVAIFVVVGPKTRPNAPNRGVFVRRIVQTCLGILAKIIENKARVLVNVVAEVAVGLVAGQGQIPKIAAFVGTIIPKNVQFFGAVVQLQTTPRAVVLARTSRQRQQPVGAKIHIFFEPDVDNARIASGIKLGRRIGNNLNFINVIARHGPQHIHQVGPRQIRLFAVYLHHHALFAA